MEKLGDRLSETAGGVDEVKNSIDSLHQSRSQHTDGSENEGQTNLQQAVNLGASSSGSGREDDDDLTCPLSQLRWEADDTGEGHVCCHVIILSLSSDEGADEDEEDADHSQTTHQPVGESEDTNPMCRTCGPGENVTDPDNLLVRLGCRCRGSLSTMHRMCILQWYGPRICEDEYHCELCNDVLGGAVVDRVYRALLNVDSGQDILITAITSSRPSSAPPRPDAQAPPRPGARQASVIAGPHHQVNLDNVHQQTQRPHHTIMYMAHHEHNLSPHGGNHSGGLLTIIILLFILVLIACTGTIAIVIRRQIHE